MTSIAAAPQAGAAARPTGYAWYALGVMTVIYALNAVDRNIVENPGVTFQFGYAGDTRFTFTAAHPKACQPQVRRK